MELNALLHEEPLASQLKEAFAVPFEHDICEAMTRVEDYLPLTGYQNGYFWSREHHAGPDNSKPTSIDCLKYVMGVRRKSFAKILHKIRCDNVLSRAHDLVSKSKPCSGDSLTMGGVLSARDQLQGHTPGLDMHLHMDQESFNRIKTSPGIYLVRRSDDASSYDAYRGTIETKGEGFKIHLWVAPPSLTQRGFSTVNFMTTHGGILFKEHPIEVDVGSLCKNGRTAIKLGETLVEYQHDAYRPEPRYFMSYRFSMSIGNPKAIIRLP